MDTSASPQSPGMHTAPPSNGDVAPRAGHPRARCSCSSLGSQEIMGGHSCKFTGIKIISAVLSSVLPPHHR